MTSTDNIRALYPFLNKWRLTTKSDTPIKAKVNLITYRLCAREYVVIHAEKYPHEQVYTDKHICTHYQSLRCMFLQTKYLFTAMASPLTKYTTKKKKSNSRLQRIQTSHTSLISSQVLICLLRELLALCRAITVSVEKTTEEQQLSSLSENETKIAHNAGETGKEKALWSSAVSIWI